MQGRASWEPRCGPLSCHSAATQDKTCLNINKREQQKERERTKAREVGEEGKQDQRLESKPVSGCHLEGSRSVCPDTPRGCGCRGEGRHPTKCQTEATPNCLNAPTLICPLNCYFKISPTPVLPRPMEPWGQSSHVRYGDCFTQIIAKAGNLAVAGFPMISISGLVNFKKKKNPCIDGLVLDFSPQSRPGDKGLGYR